MYEIINFGKNIHRIRRDKGMYYEEKKKNKERLIMYSLMIVIITLL
jgi:hypothetical protein